MIRQPCGPWVTEIGTDVNSLSGIHSISVGIGYGSGSHVIEGPMVAGAEPRGGGSREQEYSKRENAGDPHAAASHISRATSTRARRPKTTSNHQP